jgi:hypothetical protein
MKKSLALLILSFGGIQDPKHVGQSGQPSPESVTLVNAPHVGWKNEKNIPSKAKTSKNFLLVNLFFSIF